MNDSRRSPVKAVLVQSLAYLLILSGSPLAAADSPAGADDQPRYPLAVAVDGGVLYVVDLDLPGVWQIKNDQRSLFVRGSHLLRHKLNRPRCVAVHPQGGILVGDSATREVYHIANQGAEPQPLCQGRIGIAMALAVSPDGESAFIGDAEKRAVFRIPIEGGEPELIARVNARGLAFDGQGNLWAVTPDDAAVQRIDVVSKQHEAIVSGRPFQYPNGLTWSGDEGYVTDGYGKSVWRVTSDGTTEVWHQGQPLLGPVGIASDQESLFVADPKQRQVYQFSRSDKAVTERMR